MGLCFAYMDKPDTEKHSNDESNEKLNCGTSFMQGWRETQEVTKQFSNTLQMLYFIAMNVLHFLQDAYNCILDYDTDTSYFAVYDGHGGEEVAMYCSQKLPNFLKHLEDYKAGNIEKALEVSFLQFDATLLTNEVGEELQELRNQIYKERKKKDDRSDSSSESEEEDVDSLYKEAVMPIEELVEKYKKGEIYKDNIKDPKKQAACSSKDVASCSNSEIPETSGVVVSASTSVKNDVSLKKDNSNHKTSDDDVKGVDETCTNVASKVDFPDSSGDIKDTCTQSTTATEKEIISQNGKFESVQNSQSTKPNLSSLYETQYENGKVMKKGKGKAVTKTKGVTPEVPIIERPKRTKTELGQMLLSSEEEEEDEEFEDEKDLTFEGPDESSDDDDNDDDDEENESPRSSEDSSVEDEDDERTKRYAKFCKNKQEENWSTPFDSAFKCGTTAVVALLKGNELYVANAGDSRCVLCRNGKAVAMSFDHNPFLAQEEARVKKAGGYVGRDGRVNGGLNLSRALGDHSYKQNKELSDREQIITALPDVKTITIKPGEDEFMILACDGIWNSMSRQKVVDFVRTRIEAGQEKMSVICEELFDNCLSPNTFDDGLGCDNMTAVIVQFKHKKSLKNPYPIQILKKRRHPKR
ncbi:protein phosphatase 2c [Holotrichia oblita]|uniref:Protein phosphatase 2c n=1 Tax=Holotrichia oblita TaxID=644536 RepID=A0ACB9T3P1_HOLOL|nr:protein phosphatase 2c [Holotrichia oblita]